MRDKLFHAAAAGGLGALRRSARKASFQVTRPDYDVNSQRACSFTTATELRSTYSLLPFSGLGTGDGSPRARMGQYGNGKASEAVDQYYRAVQKARIPSARPTRRASASFCRAGRSCTRQTMSAPLDERHPSGDWAGPSSSWNGCPPSSGVVMEAFEDYWQGAPGVERIIWRTIPEESTRVPNCWRFDRHDSIGDPGFVPQLRAAG